MAKQVIKYNQKSGTIFWGFYESTLEDWDNLSDMLSWDAHEEGRTIMVKVNSQEHQEAIGKEITKMLHNYVKDDEIFGEFKFVKINSPRYYNFETDTLEIEVEVDIELLAQRIMAEKEAYKGLNRYLRENYSDRSGFVSWIPNNCADLFLKLKPDSRESDVLLDYWFLHLIYAEKYSEAWDVQGFIESREESWYHDDLVEFAMNEIYEHYTEVDNEREADLVCKP